jgi:hypothetical protein
MKLTRIVAGGLLLLASGCAVSDSDELTGPPLIVVNNPGQITPVRTVITSIARCDANTARRDTVLFRSLPQEICVGDNGSFSRSGATISTLYWQNTVGGRREGKNVSYIFSHEGSYDIEAQAIDSTGVAGDTKWISFRIDMSKLKTDTTFITKIVRDTVIIRDTVPGSTRTDTIIKTITVTVPGRVDTLTWRRPVAEIQLIGPKEREVGDEVCAEEVSAASPHGLAITGRQWIRDDNSKANGPKTCLRAKYPGDMVFVYQVVDEKGNASLMVSEHLNIKPKSEPPPPPPPQCPTSPNIFFKAEHVGTMAQVIAENASSCPYTITLKTFRETNPPGTRGTVVIGSDEAVIGPKGSSTARLVLRAKVDSCEYFAVVYINGKEVEPDFPLRSHLCTSG